MFKLTVLAGMIFFGYLLYKEWKKYKALYEADEKLEEQEIKNVELNVEGEASLQREENDTLDKELNQRGNR